MPRRRLRFLVAAAGLAAIGGYVLLPSDGPRRESDDAIGRLKLDRGAVVDERTGRAIPGVPIPVSLEGIDRTTPSPGRTVERDRPTHVAAPADSTAGDGVGFAIPSVGAGPTGALDFDTWARKAVYMAPTCVVVIPGRFPTGDLIVVVEALDRDGRVSAESTCQAIRLSAVSMAVLLRVGPAREQRARISLRRGGTTLDAVEVIVRRQPTNSLEVASRMRALIDFSGASELSRAHFARVAAGEDTVSSLVQARKQVEAVADLIRSQLSEADGADAHDVFMRRDAARELERLRRAAIDRIERWMGN